MDLYSLYKVKILSIIMTINLVASFAFANSGVNGKVYLDPTYDMSVPAMLLSSDEKDNSFINTYDNVVFPRGTTFVNTGMLGAGSYGDNNHSSTMPLIFVNPVLPNGEADLSITVGFPAHFLKNTDNNETLANSAEIKSAINDIYKSSGTTFEDQKSKVNEYLSFSSRIQNSGQANIKVFNGLKTSTSSIPTPPSVPTSGVDETAVTSSILPPTASASETSSGSIPPPPSVRVEGRPENSGRPQPEVSRTQPPAPPSAEPKAQRPAPPSAEPKSQRPTAAADVTNSSAPNYKTDPRFSGVVEVYSTEAMDKAIVKIVADDGQTSFGRKSSDIQKENSKFVPVMWESMKTNGNGADQTVFGAFYRVNANGDFTLNAKGQPELYYLPISKLAYKDSANETKPVTVGFMKGDALTVPTPAAKVADQTKPAAAPKSIPPPPSATSAEQKNEVASTPRDIHPPLREKAPEKTTEPAKVEEPKVATGPSISLSECRNQDFAKSLVAAGENCKLVEMTNFQLVKSQLMQQLKGESQNSSILMSSGLIAMDNSTKSCSKISVTQEKYVDDSRAQAQIEEYKKEMNKTYSEIFSSMFKLPLNSRRQAAFAGNPEVDKNTYSCARNQTECRFSYDHYTPSRMPLVQEISSYSDNPALKESVKIYGPSDDNKYLIRIVKNGKDQRALVLQENSRLILSGDVGRIIKQMKSYNKDFKHDSLSEIQSAYSSDRLRDSKDGHFITMDSKSNGKDEKISARLGTPEALSLIGQIRRNKKFYELQCGYNPLRHRLQQLNEANTNSNNTVD